MIRVSVFLSFSFIISLFTGCTSYDSNYQEKLDQIEPIHQSFKKVTDVIVHDIFSPPQASRNYAYPAIAAYEAGRHADDEYHTLAGQLNGFDMVPEPDSNKIYSFGVSANVALLSTARYFIFSEDKINKHLELYLSEIKSYNIDPVIIQNSIQFGEKVSEAVIAWAKKDGYNESRSFPKFDVTEDPSRWKPTPPGYMEGIEPHWREIRPFVINGPDQFTPEVPTPFSMDKDAPFYKELMEVYDVSKSLDDEQKEIASFWDCNPYVLNVTGHVMHASKKITPGGHWMNIVTIACRKANADFMTSLKAYALTSIGLADGFISCWDEKYRSNLVRPETLINEYVDEDWLPLLQTPPFPEYTSGHSVISSAAAVALTSVFGPSFSFEDDTEVEYGIPMRKFDSFLDASSEAAISRLYGGIHYRPAIDNGVKQGLLLGEYVVSNIQFN
jgi:hypothetical protein